MPTRLKLFFIVFLTIGFVCFGCKTRSSQKLQDAVEIGDQNQVKLLLQNGAIINGTDNRGRTALYVAVLNGKSNVVARLIIC
jgi:predicted component of type VI protein secretion system